MVLHRITQELIQDLAPLEFSPPVACVYNPLIYAQSSYLKYLDRFCRPPHEVVLVGMNPGPWGMVQTGVPFGEVHAVREWMKIDERIDRPAGEHPKRPVQGLACTRSEVSGARLWGWAQDLFKTPTRFSQRFFVTNYCPLSFLEATGRNRTPDKLPIAERRPLFAACDKALRKSVEHLRPRFVIGIGAFAETRAKEALEGLDITIGRILHPSPANPRANKGWAPAVTDQMLAHGIKLPKEHVCSH